MFIDNLSGSAATFEYMYQFLEDHYFSRIAAGPVYLTGRKTEIGI